MKITFQDRVTGLTTTTASNMSLYYWAEKWGNTDQGRAVFFPDDSGIWHRVVLKPNAGTACVEDIFVIDIEDSEVSTIQDLVDCFVACFPDYPIDCRKSDIIYIMNYGAF